MLNIIGNFLHHMTTTLADRRRRRIAYAELSALDDRSLADIGISRSEITYVLSHSTKRQAPDAPAVAGRFQHAA